MMFEEIKSICRARKSDYLDLLESFGPMDREVLYAKGVYFGLLAALAAMNNGEPVRI